MLDSMFSNDSPLRVRRVRSYRVPRYPSHTDPDPTTNPEPVPYPWKSSVAAALLALGEVSCGKKEVKVSASSPRPDSPPPPGERVITPGEAKVVDEILADVLRATPKGERNPFALSLGFSGLPYVSSPYGTGAPTTLDSALAQKLITRIFSAEGLKPQPTTFEEDDFTATAQGYDPEKHIGYIIGDWENLDESAASSWMWKDFQRIASGERKVENADDPRFLQSIDNTGSFLIHNKNLLFL